MCCQHVRIGTRNIAKYMPLNWCLVNEDLVHYEVKRDVRRLSMETLGRKAQRAGITDTTELPA